MKNTAIPLIGVLLIAVSGCTGSFSKVRGAMNDAPEWYGDRRDQIRGDGYPELVEVPVITAENRPGQTLSASADRVTAVSKDFVNNPRAALPTGGLAEVEAVRAEISQQFTAFDTSSNIMTEAEVEALRASFDVPRVTRGLRTSP